jgi:hypothetical protein
VVILTRKQDVVDSINNDHKNCSIRSNRCFDSSGTYVSDAVLPENITATASAEEALSGAEYIIVCNHRTTFLTRQHAVPVQASQGGNHFYVVLTFSLSGKLGGPYST